MEGEEEEEQQVGGRVHERDNEQREDEIRVRGEEPESNNDAEQQKECNEQDIQTQQDGGIGTQMELTDSLQSALDTVELDDQRNKELSDVQQEGISMTQMDETDSLLDTVEINDQSNKEQSVTNEREQGKENQETQGKASKRRRSIKVMPNLDTARKKCLKMMVLSVQISMSC